MTINSTWAYNSHDHEYKSSQMLIRSLVEVASRGGKFLLNVGPQPDGVIEPEFQERLRAIGSWLSVNGESILWNHVWTGAGRFIDSDDGEEGQSLRSRV
jgi:alpha-L-fucosidase